MCVCVCGCVCVCVCVCSVCVCGRRRYCSYSDGEVLTVHASLTQLFSVQANNLYLTSAYMFNHVMYISCSTLFMMSLNPYRPRKVPLPPNDDPVTLVTPPTAPRLLREQPKKSKPRVKSGMASRRSARLLSGKK